MHWQNRLFLTLESLTLHLFFLDSVKQCYLQTKKHAVTSSERAHSITWYKQKRRRNRWASKQVSRRYMSVTGVGFRWRVVGDMTGWLGSSVVECLHGQRKALGSSPVRATIFHLLHENQATCSWFSECQDWVRRIAMIGYENHSWSFWSRFLVNPMCVIRTLCCLLEI